MDVSGPEALRCIVYRAKPTQSAAHGWRQDRSRGEDVDLAKLRTRNEMQEEVRVIVQTWNLVDQVVPY